MHYENKGYCEHGDLPGDCVICDLERVVAEFTTENDNLKEENAEHKQLIYAQEEMIEDLRKEIASVSSSRNAYLKQHDNLAAIKYDLTEQVEELRKANTDLTKNYKAAMDKIDYLTTPDGAGGPPPSVVFTKDERIKAMGWEISDLRKASSKQVDEIIRLRQEIAKEQARKHAAVDAVGRAGKFCIADDDDSITEKKARDLIDSGHNVVGYVLSNTKYNDGSPVEENRRKFCFIVGGRSEWFGAKDWFERMCLRGDQERKIIDLENDNLKLKEQLDMLQARNDALVRENAELEKDAADQSEEIQGLEEHDTFVQAAKFRDELKEEWLNHESCKEVLESVREMHAEANRRIQELETRNADLKRLVEYRDGLGDAPDNNKDIVTFRVGTEWDEHNARLHAQDDRIKFLQGEVDGLQRDRDMFRQAALKSKELWEKAQANFHELEIRQSDEIKAVRQKNFALEEQSVHDAETIQERDSQIATLENEVDKLKVRCQTVNDEWRERYDQEKKAWMETQDTLKLANEKREWVMKDYSTIVEECGRHIATIKERDSQIAVLIKQTTGTEKLLEKVCAERDELKKELRDFDERACAKLKEIMAMKNSQIEKLQSQHDMFRDEFLRIKACPGADSEIKGLCDRAVKDIERVVPLVAENESFKLENAEVRRERDSLQEKLDEALKAIKHSETRCGKFENLLQDVQGILDEKKEQLKASQDMVAAYAKDNEKLQAESVHRLLVIEAALKKLNLAHIKYQDYGELIKVIEGLPYMSPVYTATCDGTRAPVTNTCYGGAGLSDPKGMDKAFQTLYGCLPKKDEQARRCELCGATPRAIRPDASATRYYGCRTPGCENYSASLSLQSWNLLMASQRKVKEDSAKPMSAPTWPRYTQRQGPEMAPEEISNMMAGAELAAKEEDKKEPPAGAYPNCAVCAAKPIIKDDDSDGLMHHIVKCSNDKCSRGGHWYSPGAWDYQGHKEIGGGQLDPGKAIQDVHEPPNCAICGSEAEATCVRDKKGGYSVLRVRCSNPECAESGHQHTPGNWNDEAGGSLCPECGSRPSTQTDVEWEERVIRRCCSNKSCVRHRPWLDASSWNRLQKKKKEVCDEA